MIKKLISILLTSTFLLSMSVQVFAVDLEGDVHPKSIKMPISCITVSK